MPKGPIIVCGGSYMTPAHSSNYYAGTHFSELIAAKLGVDLVVLSNGGCSNFSVALQIEKAIKWRPRPTLILAGNVPYDRIDLPIQQDDMPDISIDDQIFHIPDFITYHRNERPKFISTAIQDFFSDPHLGNWKNEFSEIDKFIPPIQSWFETCYHHDIKRKMDYFICYAYYHLLHESKIPYFICQEFMRNFHNDCPWLFDKQGNYKPHVVSTEVDDLIFNDEKSKFNSPFHTSKKCQEQIADKILSVYEKNIDLWG